MAGTITSKLWVRLTQISCHLPSLISCAGRGATFHRAQFRMAIAEHIAQFPQVTVQFNKRVVRVEGNSTGPSQIVFSDGTTVQADVVIG